MHSAIDRCRICGGSKLASIVNLGTQSLTGVFPRDKHEPVPSGPLELVKCSDPDGCGLVQLRHSYQLSDLYGMNYGYRSGLNPSMVRHLHAQVERILKSGVLRDGDLVIDVGSNDATTLKLYPDNRFELIGIDPTGIKFSQYYPQHVRLIPEFFSGELVRTGVLARRAKVITSFAMFYDLESPLDFMRQIDSVLDDDGLWVFEQSYLPAMLDTNSFDTICQEHLEFYALKQIKWMTDRAGLKIMDVEFNDVNGGSFCITAAKAASRHPEDTRHIGEILRDEQKRGLDALGTYAQFASRADDAKITLRGFLKEARAAGKRVAGLGASTKGNVLLQHFGIDQTMLYCIGEVNPDKFGSYTPGTLIPIRPEHEVLAEQPDYLLVLPWHFRPFFLSLPSLAGRKLVFPLPRFEVVCVPARPA